MSITPLNDVYDEVRRLAIAGSGLASGDFRLKKLLPALKKSATKAPIFGKVADAVERLADSTPQASAGALLDLSTLVSAILYTQGETGVDGPLQPIETSDLDLPVVNASARMLKPLVEALTGTGSGRHEMIVDAHCRGVFKDLRLVGPALQALDDGYGECADFVAAKVLPLYGKAIYDDLQNAYDPKGKGGAIRRLRLMHRLDPKATRVLVEQALESGSKELKIAALECLAGSREALPTLLVQTKAKSAEVRKVALRCLANFTDEAVVDAILKALSGDDLALAAEAASQNPSPRLLSFLLEEGEKQLSELLAPHDKAKAKAMPGRFYALLECFASRCDKQTIAFLTRCFQRRDDLAKLQGDCSGHEINRRIASLLVQSNVRPAQKLVLDAIETLAPEVLDVAIVAAIRLRKPKEVYDLLSPYYLAKTDSKKKGSTPAGQKRERVREALSRFALGRQAAGEGIGEDESGNPALGAKSVELDPRWLDAAVQAEDLEIVQILARPGHAGACGLLSEALEAMLRKKGDLDYSVSNILETMIRIGHPKAVDYLAETIQRAAGSKRAYYTYWLVRLIPDLPPNATPKIEGILPSLPEKLADELAPYLAELQAKSV